MIPHISKDTFLTEKIYLNILTDKSQQVSVMYVKGLKQYIHSVVKNLDLQEKLQYDIFDDNIWFLFAGDKAGKHMKFRFEIIIVRILVQPKTFIILLCMKVLILVKIWLKFNESLREILRNFIVRVFLYAGISLRCFQGGDYYFLYDCLGHQGSSATYPSAKDQVTLDHLRKHPGMAHIPENCQ